jgi:hypothetical protein
MMMIRPRKYIVWRRQSILVACFVLMVPGAAFAEPASEAAGSCVVIHEPAGTEKKATTTCFENIALERTSFESGVCQWKSDAQAAENVQSTTHFVPYCPPTYSAWCDRLVLGPQMIAPVKIFIYDRSAEVLERARKQCLSGGGKWNTNDKEAE